MNLTENQERLHGMFPNVTRGHNCFLELIIIRATLHPILHSRIGPDQFVSRMARLREDPRFRAVQPDAFDTDGTAAEMPSAVAPVTDNSEGGEGGEHVEEEEGLELWFDWAFVDFWKNHYCKS